MTDTTSPGPGRDFGPNAISNDVTGRRRVWIWLLVICLVIAAGGVYVAYLPSEPSGDAQQRPGKDGRSAADRVMPVVVAHAATGDIGVYLNGLGSVVPLHTVTVRSRIDGQLMKVLFREGQVVKEGELLAEIDPRAYQVQLSQAEGQMARDQALLKNALIDLERYRVLFRQDSVAKQQLDTQEALVRQYEGTVTMDQAAIDNAKLQLIYCRITAPVGGRLGLRQVDAGNIVHANDANGLVVITQLQPITVAFAIPEDSLPPVMKKLQAGEKLPVDAYDRSERTKLANGTLLSADNQIDSTTGTVKLKALFANTDSALFPNQFVNVHLLVEVRRGATVVPGAAVQRGARGTFVYVAKSDSTVTVRPVRLGPAQGENVSVEDGIVPGEAVVVDGADKLREGARVDLAPRDSAPAKDGAPAGKGRRPHGDASAKAGPR